MQKVCYTLGSFRNHLQLYFLILSEFKQINHFLIPVKASENLKFAYICLMLDAKIGDSTFLSIVNLLEVFVQIK